MTIRKYSNLFTIMHFMRILIASFFVTVSANVLASPTYYEQTPADWNGFYITGQLGGSWNDSHWHYTNANYFNTIGSTVLGNNFNFNSNSVIGGANLGFNYQIESLILGLEAGGLGVDLKSSKASPFFPTDNYTMTVHYFTTAKARIGYAYQAWLIYLNGGWAGGNVLLTLTDAPGGVRATSSDWTNGWVAGGGIDYRFTEQFSVGASYDYIELNVSNRLMSCSTCGAGVGFGAPVVSSHLRTQAVMLHLNYLFNQYY